MAGYVREKLQILGGGWNILPPVDKTPKTDYLLAQNWRVDRTGKLASRWGYPLKFQISGMSFAHSAANNGGDESDYYVACNALSGSNPCSIYYNGTTVIVSGLSGYRVGFAALLGWMFIMDRVKQGRYNGTTWHNWGIDPPTTALTAAVGATHVGGTSGDYYFYCTFETADNFYETGPGPVTPLPTTTAGNDIDFSALPTSSDPELVGGSINIYATGGTLGAPYLVLSIPITSTTGSWTTNDLIATDEGVVMPTAHTAPPAGAGLAGPYLSRLYTWVGNRLYYTPPGLPQYWNTDAAVGDWVDVGSDGERIQWCIAHTNVLMIYKEKSIWRLIGDPTTGTLEQVEEGIGLTSPFAITRGSGSIDYFVSPGGLRVCNMDHSQPFGAEISPLFNMPIVNSGPTTPPGSILPGPDYIANIDSIDCYAIALGYAMGKLYVSYNENVSSAQAAVLAVYYESSKQWMYHRNDIFTYPMYGFLFDGIMMVGLTGLAPTGSVRALGYNLDDFRLFYTNDQPPVAGPGIVFDVAYQSHFEDAGLPDNQKMWLEVVIDYLINSADTLSVYVGYDNFAPALVGTITGAGLRKQFAFPLGTDGILAKNISVMIYGTPTDYVELHNVYIYYYPEARLALAASTLPSDLGTAAVKQCKELILDIDTSYGAGGAVDVNIYSDLPGNSLTVRQTPVVAAMAGRALVKFPFTLTEGYLWRVALTAATTAFRLYSVRLLMRPIGTYIEAYESAAGFVWDSGPLTFESGITHIPRGYAIALAALPIKRFREISIELETFGGDVLVTFLTDLPGESLVSRFTATVNTAARGRCFIRLPFPLGIGAAAYNPGSTYIVGAFASYAGQSWKSLLPVNIGNYPAIPSTWWEPLPIEGRMCQFEFSGTSAYVIYDLSVEVLAVGVYIEAYEASGGAVYDSREVDFGSAKPKEARELELDIETTGSITATLYCDLPGYQMMQCFQATGISTAGRQKVKLPLTLDTLPFDYPIGRLFRLVITGASAFRLYDAKLLLREFGCYLTGDEVAQTPAGVWDSTPIDYGNGRMMEFKKLEFEIQTDTGGAATLNLWTDQPAGAITLQFTTTINTSGGRQSVKIPLTPGIRGRLLQVEIASWGARLFNGRVWARELNNPKAQWAWYPLPIPLTPPEWKWIAFTVAPTEAQWFWAKCLTVVPSPDEFTVIDVPFEVTGA